MDNRKPSEMAIKGIHPTDKIQISAAGTTGYRLVKNKWQGPPCNELQLMEHLSDGQPRSVSDIEAKLPGLSNPSVKEIIQYFLKTKRLEKVSA